MLTEEERKILKLADSIRDDEYYQRQRQRENDDLEAEKHSDRWFSVIQNEIDRMRDEGVDPYIAWLAVVRVADCQDDNYRLDRLRPDPKDEGSS